VVNCDTGVTKIGHIQIIWTGFMIAHAELRRLPSTSAIHGLEKNRRGDVETDYHDRLHVWLFRTLGP
jgi:hypothetical protein